MPPLVIDIRAAEDMRDVVHRAVQALHEGNLVVFPTETVYTLAACALSEEGIRKLLRVKNRQPGEKPLTLALKSVDDALDYLPNMSPLALRMARRCWPGPITLVCEDKHPHSLLRMLPASVQAELVPQGDLGIRVPGHPLIIDTLRMLSGPIALTSANRSGQPETLTVQDAVKALGDEVKLYLDDGRSRFGQASSVVRVSDKLTMLRAGVVGEKTLKRLSAMMILIVCTGNTCRSPMAEGIARKMIAERMKCPPEELHDRGILVISAGIAANLGNAASGEGVEVLKPLGIDLNSHESQPVTEQLIKHADIIWTMTRSHRQAILDQWPDAGERTFTLSLDNRDIADPIGGPIEYYRKCAAQITTELEQRLRDLPLPDLSQPDA